MDARSVVPPLQSVQEFQSQLTCCCPDAACSRPPVHPAIAGMALEALAYIDLLVLVDARRFTGFHMSHFTWAVRVC